MALFGLNRLEEGQNAFTEAISIARRQAKAFELRAATSLARFSPDKLGGCPDDCPGGIRHVGGAKPDQALVRNVRTCRPDAKGKVQVAKTARAKVLMRGTGAEQPVVGLKVL